MPPETRLFGIRHHGPGSAAGLVRALDAFRPDVVLLESPADTEGAMRLIGHEELKPPVAVLVYNPKDSRQATFLPFAEFSPEWQAVRWCRQHGAHLRAFDLPMNLRFGWKSTEELAREQAEAAAKEAPARPEGSPEPEQPDTQDGKQAGSETQTPEPETLAGDPIGHIAALDGYADGERWWEARIEHADAAGGDAFAVVLELMTALREAQIRPETELTLLREAFMREALRATLTQGYERVAVVCGAWHTPALTGVSFKQKEDRALLKGLKKVPTEVTWTPWTFERLATSSGYAAGVVSPAWYELLFTVPREQVVTHWLVRAARLLRAQDLDASAAHAIEGVRLAHTLATVRGLALPGIEELEEAAVAIFGGGYADAVSLVRQELVIGHRLGEVPADVPATPLQQDLAQQQKSLRLAPEATEKPLDLDLRKDLDLRRSHLLHRLRLLDIEWAEPQEVSGKAGTFHELWTLRWRPELTLNIIEAGRWGNTVLAAATAFTRDRAVAAPTLAEVSFLVERALHADLAAALPTLVARLETLSATTLDTTHLLAALPPLVQVRRYGNVRRTDTAAIAHVLRMLVPRLCLGLPGATISLDHDAATTVLAQVEAAHRALLLLQDAEFENQWFAALAAVARHPLANGLLAGAAVRFGFDGYRVTADEVATALGLALAPAQPTDYATAWLEGFLRGSGLLLIHHRALFGLLDAWLAALPEDTFRRTVPLLRRAFSEFSRPERAQVLDLAVQAASPGGVVAATGATEGQLDETRVRLVLPVLEALLANA